MLKQIDAGVLNVAYRDEGDPDGKPVILLHGFPYDICSYDDVTPLLISGGCRVITPYLRGYGPTRFLSKDTPRSGQQASLAYDLLSLMDALAIPGAVLAGYDWGGRAACILAALSPERVTGLVSAGGYNIQDIAGSVNPADPEDEYSYWYQYYFHSERGRLGLEKNRFELCKLLWQLWSPNWQFSSETYVRTAESFNNPDFVDVVIHSYRHRYGLVPGDPAFEGLENQLKALPKISVPTVVIEGEGDGVMRVEDDEYHRQFLTNIVKYQVLPLVGHNLPQEAPQEFAQVVLSLIPGSRSFTPNQRHH